MNHVAKTFIAIACLLLVAPPAAAEGTDTLIQDTYDDLADAAITTVSCDWAVVRSHLEGANQSTTPVDFAESNYNARIRDPVATALTSGPVYEAVRDVNDVHGPGADAYLEYGSALYTYAKCTAGDLTIWTLRSYFWDQPTVTCYYRHVDDCGIPNLECNEDVVFDVIFETPFVIFGEPMPETDVCVPPAGINCLCTPPTPGLPPSPPSPEEVLG